MAGFARHALGSWCAGGDTTQQEMQEIQEIQERPYGAMDETVVQSGVSPVL